MRFWHWLPQDVGAMTLQDFYLCRDLADQIVTERRQGR